jgi:taurine dioxygenase
MQLAGLAGSFGARVELDADDRARLDDLDVQRALAVALATHHVMVLPGGFDADEQLAVMRAFGRVLPQGPRAMVNDRGPDVEPPLVIHVSNTRPDGVLGDDPLAFHHEFAYLAEPVTALSLYAEEVIDGRSATRFVDGAVAHRLLSGAQRERLRGLQALFVAQYDATIRRELTRHRDHLVDPTFPRAVHPLVVCHPVSGEDVLYLNDSQVDRVLGLADDDSEALLAELFAVLYRPECSYEHRWHHGELVVWDNLAVQHGRPAGDPVSPRTLRRVVVGPRAPWEQWPDRPPQ